MNCQSLISSLGFECMPLGEDALRLWSPFTYGNDGEVVGLYVERVGAGFKVTDNAEALLHAASMGVNLTARRMDAVRRIAEPGVQVSDGGVISMSVGVDQLPVGIASVLGASLAVGHFETLWLPRIRGESFVKQVADVLGAEFGGRLHHDVRVTGASGHQLELPLAVVNAESTTYVQPVASGDERVDWQGVYSGFGKMIDLKNAGASNDARIVVIEDSTDQDDLGKAISMLNAAATVVPFSQLRLWAARHASAA